MTQKSDEAKERLLERMEGSDGGFKNINDDPRNVKRLASQKAISTKKWTSRKKKIVIIAGIILLAWATFMTVMYYQAPQPSVVNTFSGLPVVTVHGIFVDMNGDGKLDYVPYAQVILNPGGKQNFPQPDQPLK